MSKASCTNCGHQIGVWTGDGNLHSKERVRGKGRSFEVLATPRSLEGISIRCASCGQWVREIEIPVQFAFVSDVYYMAEKA